MGRVVGWASGSEAPIIAPDGQGGNTDSKRAAGSALGKVLGSHSVPFDRATTANEPPTLPIEAKKPARRTSKGARARLHNPRRRLWRPLSRSRSSRRLTIRVSPTHLTSRAVSPGHVSHTATMTAPGYAHDYLFRTARSFRGLRHGPNRSGLLACD